MKKLVNSKNLDSSAPSRARRRTVKPAVQGGDVLVRIPAALHQAIMRLYGLQVFRNPETALSVGEFRARLFQRAVAQAESEFELQSVLEFINNNPAGSPAGVSAGDMGLS